MQWRTTLLKAPGFAAIAVVAACSGEAATDLEQAPQFGVGAMSETAAQFGPMMDDINVMLAEAGEDYRVMKVEYIAQDEMGGELLQRDIGNMRLGADFVPNDARRVWSGAPGGSSDDITFAVDQVDATPVFGGVSGADASNAIARAMGTWDSAQCSELSITQSPDFGIDVGLIAFLNGLGGSPFVFADIQHAGFDEINFTGGVIGATFTFIFTDGGAPTDIDGNGLADVAFREIYYDPSWLWQDDGSANIDIETVALHEAGHALSQAHFGNLFLQKGALKANPRAVMNAFYGGPLPALLGTDEAGHCGNWANWPERLGPE